MAALTSLMTRFCTGEDSWLARCSTSDPSTSETRDGNGKPRCNKDRRRTKENSPKSMAVNAGFKSSRQNQKKPPLQDNRDELSNLNKILDRICQIHSTPGKPANHTHRDCWVLKQSGKLNAEHKGLDTPSKDDDEPRKQSTRKQKNFPQEVKIVNLLHITKQAAPIEVHTIRPIPKESRHWLLKPITFNHLDYSGSIRNACWTALVSNPIIGGLHFTNVLMDGGSGLNLIYQDTIRHMGIDPAKIRHSETSFKGVTPGPDAHCTGSLRLEVKFGSPDNFCRERLIFHITPFSNSYQALMGREAFARFNAIPHYASLTLKMPGPRGIISLKGNIERSSSAKEYAAALSTIH